MLVSGFTRSLRDGFHHARIAALMALNGKFGHRGGFEVDLIFNTAVSHN